MFCTKCGCQVNDDVNFCPKCGTQLQALREESATSRSKTNVAISQNGGELDHEALKIYLTDILAVECARAKLKKCLEAEMHKSSNLKRWNYMKQYEICKLDGINGGTKYIFFFFDGNTYYIFTEVEYGKRIILCSDPSWVKHGQLLVITDKTIRNAATWSKWYSGSDKRKYTKMLLDYYEDFKKTAPAAYQANLQRLEGMKQSLNRTTFALNSANKLLQKSYNANIIPITFRNIYAVYYLCKFVCTSGASLETAMLHYDLNEIKKKLDTIIEQQQEIILRQAVIVSQSRQLMEDNRVKLERLASIEHNTREAAQYAEIAAINAETCAWFARASWIDRALS